MVIFAALAAAFGSLLAAAQVAITIASLLYQRQRQKKLEKEADKQKGFDLAIDGDPIHLPLVYGTQKIGGVRTFHQTYTSIATDTDNDSDGWTRYRFPENRWTPAQDNSHNSDHANSYLVIQQALCFGGIDSIVDVEVNSQNWNARNFWHLIEVHKDGGSANPSAVATGIPATNKFTNTAWLHASFWLNRDNFNYSGVPNVSVYVKGQKVWTLKNTGGVIQLDQKIYSNNNSYVLMDYLLRPKNLGGVGLGGLTVEQWLAGDMPDTTRINLTSFFNSANICATVVEPNVKVKGRINGVPAVDRTVETLAERGNGAFDGEYISVTADDTIWRWQKGALISPAEFVGRGEGREEVSPAVYAPSVWIEITSTRDIHLYECNITIDTERSFRDNIELLLETMGGSELIFAEGKYKLLLDYPEDQTEQDNLVVATYTDADIVSEDVTVSYPGASDRYNRVVVKFNNEEKDFSTDSVSFPAYLDANHQKMLAEDNGVESTQEIFLPGVSIKELAAAKAETMVRQSRLYVGDATVDPATAFSLNQKIISLTLDRKAIVLETGDLFKLDSDMTDIHGDVFKVETIRFTPQLNVEVTASQFNYTNLAYSEKSLDVPNPRKAIESVVPNVTNLAYNVGRRVGGPVNSNGYLSWTAPATGDVVSYEVWEFIEGGNWNKIGDANGTVFDVPASSDNGGDRYYSVKVKERGGKLSVGSVLFVDTLASVTPIGTVNVAQFAGGVTLDWDDSVDFLVRHYDVYWSATNTKPAEPNASTKESFFTLQPIPSDTTTYVWIDVVGFGGTVGEMLVPVEVQAGELAIDNEDLQGIIDATSFAAGIEPVTVVTSLPTVKATELVAFAGKLYRWNGTAYVATVPANDVTGQLTNDQLADIAAAKITGTITAPQIANGAVTDAKIAGMAAAKVTGQLTNAQLADIAAAKITGTITAPQIANGAVTDAKIAGMAASKVTGQLNDIQIAAISAAKLTGQIVSSQIADAALTTSKFASGIRPVEIVSSLPTTGNFVGRVVILETDGKIYRHLGTPTGSAGFVASVSSSDISGQITAAQIAALEASKITGQLTNAQIAAVAAAKLTGTITAPQIANGAVTDAKIAGLAASKVTGQLTDTQIAQVGAAKIAGQLSDSQIGDLNASKLTGSIDEARISAVSASKVTGQLSDDQIAAVNATKIAGQITTVQISNDAISAPKIGAGAVTATAIAAGAIVAGKIAADAITTATISSGAITGAKIAAGVITAEKLTIGNFSNFCDNPNFEIKDESGALVGWFPSSEFVLVNNPLQAYKGSHFVERSVADGSSRAFRNLNSFDVQEGDVYYLSCRIEGNAVCSWSGIRLTVIDANNGIISSVNIGNSPAHIPANHTGWQLVEGRVTIPSGSVKARIELVVIGQTSGTIRWDDILCARANDGRLIVDGIITAEKIAAATITSAQIAANTITASNILAGTITGDRLSANTITAEKIAAGTITSAQIAAGTIQASNIAAGTILASNIAAGTITGDKVAANAITATQIATGAITAVKIAAGTITGDKISGTTITGDKIAANTITATKIAAGTITAAQIAANTITASNISAGTITGDKIAANAITANNIAADAITAGKIAAGVISATEIASGTITASKLAVGDFTNLIPDAGLMDAASWTLNAGFELVDSDGQYEAASRVLRWNGASQTGGSANSLVSGGYSSYFVIDASREYVVGGMFRSNTSGMAGGAQTHLQWFDVNMNNLSNPLIKMHTLENTEQKYSLIVTPPAGAVYARLYARRSRDASGNVSGPCYWYHSFVRPAASGELIVDGAITASKVAASAITADKIAAATITGDKIAANTISAGNIAAATITSAQIAAGTIQASNIATDTITSNKIAAGAITASEIATGAITAVKIAAATITGDKIVGSTITGDKIAANTITAAKITSGTITSAEIAAGTIQASNIAADTITGDKIAASTITSSEIATGAITAVKIASATITGDKIVGSTITGDKIAANTITAAKIAAGTITAAEIAGSTITGDKIVANTIDTAQIAAGAIGANQIAANAIVASKVLVHDRENLFPDGGFEEATGENWTLAGTGGTITFSTTTRSGGKSLSLNKSVLTNSVNIISNPALYTHVREGDTYWAETEVRTLSGTATAGFYYRVRWYNASKTFLSSTDIATNTGLNTTWAIFSKKVVAPANAAYAGVQLYNHSTNTVVASFLIDRVVLRRANAAELIVDGTIQSNHINTGSFATSGLAVFGGNLQSSNFSTGSAGWKINQTGDAEFNSLIVRSSLVDGAVTDGGLAYALAAQHKAHNGTVAFVSVGSNVTPDTVFEVGLYFEHRDVWDAPTEPIIASRGVLQQRVRTGATWGAWTDIYVGAYEFTRDVWFTKTFLTNLILKNDGVEFKLILQNSAGIVIPSNQKTNIREVRISVRALRR